MPLEGTRVILREERPEDLPFEVSLRNDMGTQAWPKALPPDYTEAMYRKRFESREFSMSRRDGRFIIEDKGTGERVGYLSYYGLEPRFSVSYGLAVQKRFWGTGLAGDAQAVILGFMFLELGVRVVRLWTTSGNPAMVRLAEKAGFRISARVRQGDYKTGQLQDGLSMDLLREEYFALHPDLADSLPPI